MAIGISTVLPSIPKPQVNGIDMFLKITGVMSGLIKGESTDDKHKDEIQIETYQYEVVAPYDVGTGLGAGKRQHKPLRIVKRTDLSTPLLFKLMTTGEHIKEMALCVRKSGGGAKEDYLKFLIKTAMIIDFQTGLYDGDNEIPRDQVGFVFNEITIEYRAQKKDGSLGSAVSTSDNWSNNR